MAFCWRARAGSERERVRWGTERMKPVFFVERRLDARKGWNFRGKYFLLFAIRRFDPGWSTTITF